MLAIRIENTFYIDLRNESFFLVDRIIAKLFSLQTLKDTIFIYDKEYPETYNLLKYYKLKCKEKKEFFVYDETTHTREYFFDQFLVSTQSTKLT